MKRFSIILLVFFTCACEVVVDIDVPFEGEQLVVNSFVCPDSVWSASISLNRFILSNDHGYKQVRSAIVTVYDETGLVATLEPLGDGRYKSQTEKPQAGKQYTIHVSAPNYGEVEAKSMIPNPVAITSMEIKNVIRDNKPTEITVVKFMDNGDTKDFYHVRLEVMEGRFDYLTGEISTFIYPSPFVHPDNPDLNSQFISVDAGILMKDVLFNGKEAEVGIKMENWQSPSYFAGMRVVVRSVSEDYYNYMATKELQDETSGDPFAQPVSVYNNISNGFGIFAGLSNSIFQYYNPQPVVTDISPASGKVGDILTITGQNFISNLPYSSVVVRFQGSGFPWAQIIEVTDTQIKVVVPEGAVTGKLVVFRDGCVILSDMDFQVIN